jgi:hypothetical protein
MKRKETVMNSFYAVLFAYLIGIVLFTIALAILNVWL